MAPVRNFLAILLCVNFGQTILLVTMAGRLLDRFVSATAADDTDGDYLDTAMLLFGLYWAMIYLLFFALVAAAATLAAIVTGVNHVRIWSSNSGAAAQSAAWVSWVFLFLSFFLVVKEIQLGFRSQPHELRALEVCVISLTITEFIYAVSLFFDGTHKIQVNNFSAS